MAGRIFWGLVAGMAIVGGMAWQDGGIFSWDHDEGPTHRERSIDEQVDRAIDRSFDKMHVTGADGEEIDVPAETKRELASAVSRLVKAEADLALARIGDGSEKEMESARDRIADARADIDRAKAQIKSAEQSARVEQDAVREQIQREVREDVRAAVREAARN